MPGSHTAGQTQNQGQASNGTCKSEPSGEVAYPGVGERGVENRESAEVEEVLRHLKKKHRKPWRQTRTEAQRGEATSLKPHITESSAHSAPLKPTTPGRLCTAGPRPPWWRPLIRFQPRTEAAFVSSLGNHVSSLTEPTRQCGHAQEVAGNPRPWAPGPCPGRGLQAEGPVQAVLTPPPHP